MLPISFCITCSLTRPDNWGPGTGYREKSPSITINRVWLNVYQKQRTEKTEFSIGFKYLLTCRLNVLHLMSKNIGLSRVSQDSFQKTCLNFGVNRVLSWKLLSYDHVCYIKRRLETYGNRQNMLQKLQTHRFVGVLRWVPTCSELKSTNWKWLFYLDHSHSDYVNSSLEAIFHCATFMSAPSTLYMSTWSRLTQDSVAFIKLQNRNTRSKKT